VLARGRVLCGRGMRPCSRPSLAPWARPSAPCGCYPRSALAAPTNAKLIEGEALRVVSHKVNMHGRSLRWLIERLDKRHTYYLSGELMVGSKLERVQDLNLYRSDPRGAKAAFVIALFPKQHCNRWKTHDRFSFHMHRRCR
jgi:hypothetical protein